MGKNEGNTVTARGGGGVVDVVTEGYDSSQKECKFRQTLNII